MKDDEEKCKEVVEDPRTKEETKRADMPALHKERDTIRKAIMDYRETIRKVRDDFNERRKEWQNYLRLQM